MTHLHIQPEGRASFKARRLNEARLDMGWLPIVGSLKLQVSFAEYDLFYRALLQKRPIILRSLLVTATPYDLFFDP